jgi:predicted porin
MRKRLVVTLACLASPASGAFAQSSVSVFGTIDLNLTYSKAGDRSAKALDQGGYLIPSRIGFRGTEDLGDGL